MKDNAEVTLADYRGLSDQLLKNLLSEQKIFGGTWWLNAFKRFLRKEDPFDPRFWDMWMNVYFGGPKSNPKRIKSACTSKSKFALNDYSTYILNNMRISEENMVVELVVAPIEMLGFHKPATIDEVNEKLRLIGFYPLTPEMVFNLYLQMGDINECLFVSMDSISLPDLQRVFMTVSKGILSVSYNYQIPAHRLVVFAKNVYSLQS